MAENELLQRTKTYALRIIRLYVALPKTTEAQVLGKQVLRSGTSIGANVAEANQAQSDPDFISKLSIALKETVETVYWLELLKDTNYITETQAESLLQDCTELKAILIASIRTKKRNVLTKN